MKTLQQGADNQLLTKGLEANDNKRKSRPEACLSAIGARYSIY
jgi:hypothetical protein